MESLICRLDDDCDKLLICKMDLECKKTLHFDSEVSMARVSIYGLHHPCIFHCLGTSGNNLNLFYSLFTRINICGKLTIVTLILVFIIDIFLQLNEGYQMGRVWHIHIRSVE